MYPGGDNIHSYIVNCADADAVAGDIQKSRRKSVLWTC